MQEKQYCIEMEDGGVVALYRLGVIGSLVSPEQVGPPVVIAHGTLSNSESVRDLAEHLRSSGFDCWLLDWGGHGQSKAHSKTQNFEYPALNDVPVAISKILEVTEMKHLFWVSHSGGGHIALMHLMRNIDCQQHIAGLVTLGAQATDGAMGFKFKLRALFLWGLVGLLGHVPKGLTSAGPEGEPTRLLAQWSRWNIFQQWVGVDGFDYMAGLSNLTIPTFMLAGSNDDIAPESGCRKFYDALGSEDKSWLTLSEKNGFSKNFSHGQLVRGRAAKAEVFPRISDWLIQRNLTG